MPRRGLRRGVFAAWTYAGHHLDPARVGVLGIAVLFLPLYALDCHSRWRALRHG